MRLTGRHWTAAFATAALAHAVVILVGLWQASDPGADDTGPGVISVSLVQSGDTPASATTEISRVRDAEIVTPVEMAPGSPIEEAALEEKPATALPAETIDMEADTPNDVVLVEAPLQTVVLEASEPDAIEAAETAVEEVSKAASPEPIRQMLTPVDESEMEVISVAEALAGAPTFETVVQETIASLIPKAEATTVAQVEATVDPAHPQAEVEFREHVQRRMDVRAERLVSTTAARLRENVARQALIVSPPSGENDHDRSAMLAATGSSARIDSVGIRAVQDGYLRKVLERIARLKRYPREARHDGVVGTVIVRFTILADGSLQSRQLAGSSGDSRLDQAALEMLFRASPFPPIPPNLGMDQLDLSLPVQFSLGHKRTLF